MGHYATSRRLRGESRIVIPFKEVRPEDRGRIGAKAFTLAQLRQAGFNVPDGFVVPSDSPSSLDREAFIQQLGQLKGERFAVRSSASNEDGESSSMAGQYRTFLAVSGVDPVLKAISDCRNYHPQHLAKPAGIAVIVQEMIAAEVAGVMFTVNPLDPSDNVLSIEAALGLGDRVVSGNVTPDRYTVKETIQRAPADNLPCLKTNQIEELADLGRTVAETLGSPQDIEWAIANDTLWLLQSRPITGGSAITTDTIRRETIAKLRAIAGRQGTVWITDPLSESLLHPTPMTWSIMQRLLAADGGAGAMSRTIGVGPDPQLGSQSVYDLITGRPKLNLRRAAQMRFGRLPLSYPIEKYLAEPHLINAQRDREIVLTSWLQLPWILWKLTWAGIRQRHIRRKFVEEFQSITLPRFREECQRAAMLSLGSLNEAELLTFLHGWVHKICVEFGEKSQLLTHFLQLECEMLENFLNTLPGPRTSHTSASMVLELLQQAVIPAEVDLSQAMQNLRDGAMTTDEFLAKFGHRGFNDMELAQPRWREQLTIQPNETSQKRERRATVNPKFTLPARIDPTRIHQLVALRELAKDAFMRGFSILRSCLLELDRRWSLNGHIFELELSELEQFEPVPASELALRRIRRKAEAMLTIPDTILSNDLEAIGRTECWPDSMTRFDGTAISLGSATGNALVLEKPGGVPPSGPYVLVCPTSDPTWTPWFLNACAIVLERGGMLSHGAIIARELGLPAVAKIQAATRLIETGQRLHVDADAGRVTVIRTNNEPEA